MTMDHTDSGQQAATSRPRRPMPEAPAIYCSLLGCTDNAAGLLSPWPPGTGATWLCLRHVRMLMNGIAAAERGRLADMRAQRTYDAMGAAEQNSADGR